MTCYGCNQSCHLYCYGRMSPVELDNKLGYFVCDRCQVDHKKDVVMYFVYGGLGMLGVQEQGGVEEETEAPRR